MSRRIHGRRTDERGSTGLRVFGVGFVLVGIVMVGLAAVSSVDGLAGWLVAYEASVGTVLGLFGAVIALRPERVDWAVEGGFGLYALMALALAGMSIGFLGVLVG